MPADSCSYKPNPLKNNVSSQHSGGLRRVQYNHNNNEKDPLVGVTKSQEVMPFSLGRFILNFYSLMNKILKVWYMSLLFIHKVYLKVGI